MTRRATAVLVALLWVLVGCGAPAPQPHHGGVSIEMNRADIAFLTDVAAQHEQTAALLAVVDVRITDADLRTLAAAIGATQADELRMMRSWLAVAAATGGPGPTHARAHEHAPASPDPADVAKLSAAAGRDLDVTFANVLLSRQQAATELARAELTDGSASAVVGYAQRVVDSRTAQASQLLTMLTRLTA